MYKKLEKESVTTTWRQDLEGSYNGSRDVWTLIISERAYPRHKWLGNFMFICVWEKVYDAYIFWHTTGDMIWHQNNVKSMEEIEIIAKNWWENNRS